MVFSVLQLCSDATIVENVFFSTKTSWYYGFVSVFYGVSGLPELLPAPTATQRNDALKN